MTRKRPLEVGSRPPRDERRREKETVIPRFDPAELARELEASERPTVSPPDEAKAYARIVEGHVDQALPRERSDARDTPRTMTAARAFAQSTPTEISEVDEETLGR